jgi:hypothetical protein
MQYMFCFHSPSSIHLCSHKHGRTGRKKLGGRKEICPTQFQIVPVLSKKICLRNFPKLLSTGGGSGYEKFLLDSIFPTKLTEFGTFIFVISQYCPTVKRILPDWLCLPNKLGGGLPPPRPVRPWPQTTQVNGIYYSSQ